MKTKKSIYSIFTILILAALACGSDIEVNAPSEDGQPDTPSKVQPTSTSQVGTARSNPAPAGSEVIADNQGFVVISSTRPATDLIMAGNQFNTSPEAEQEYVLVSVRVTCKKSADEKCSFFSYNLKLLGSSGVQRDSEILVAGVDGLLDFSVTEFFGGATIEGSIPFIINSDETELLLVYSPFLGNPFYLAIE